MNLPDLFVQTLYGRLAWTAVATALLLALLARRQAVGPRAAVLVAVAVGALMHLPGAWSPAHWLGLAFQRPSAFAAALCVLSVAGRLSPRPAAPVLPWPLAAVIVGAGAVLYLDASGWLARGLYPMGFGAVGAPLAGLVLATAAAAAWLTGRGAGQAVALVGATALFALWRLPTGNLWDALVDPWLWVWGGGVLARRVARPRRRAREVPVAAEPATVL